MRTTTEARTRLEPQVSSFYSSIFIYSPSSKSLLSYTDSTRTIAARYGVRTPPRRCHHKRRAKERAGAVLQVFFPKLSLPNFSGLPQFLVTHAHQSFIDTNQNTISIKCLHVIRTFPPRFPIIPMLTLRRLWYVSPTWPATIDTHTLWVLQHSYFSWTLMQSLHNLPSPSQALKLPLARRFPFHGPLQAMNPKLWIYVWTLIPSSFPLVRFNETVS